MITIDELKQLMKEHGFADYVFRWDHDEEAYAIGADRYSVLFLPRHNRIAIWPYRWPNRVRYFSIQQWLEVDSEELVYRNVNPEWWERFKPVFRKIVDGFPVGPPLPAGFLNWIQGHRNIKWNRGVKLSRVMPPEPADKAEPPQGPGWIEPLVRDQKKADRVDIHIFDTSNLFRMLPRVLYELRTPPKPQVSSPIMTIEKRIQQYLKSKGVSHAWSDTDGEHVIHLVDCEIHFDVSKELITFEDRETSRETTHRWSHWLCFNDAEIKSQGLSLKAWAEIRPVILRLVQLLCGAYV